MLRSTLDYVVRRLGLLPGGTPDRLGQDRRLRSTVLPHEVMVYFADTVGSLYQIEQWYEAFRVLDRRHRVVVVMADSRTARQVRATSGLDVVVVGKEATMSGLVSRGNFKVALYVNHNPENFANLRFGSMVHASLMHGDSDKSVTVSNQTKAYDYSLVAGQAAVDRMAAFSTFYDAAQRCIPIGRPQVKAYEQSSDQCSVKGAGIKRTALYAPTWEGPQPSAAYGSVATHGMGIVQALVAGGWQVLYRPHPLTGIRCPNYGDADQRIRQFLRDAEVNASVGHRTDVQPDSSNSFALASVMVCDVSGVAMDWLATAKPLVITEPESKEVSVAQSPLTELVPRLRSEQAFEVAEILNTQVFEDPLHTQRTELIEYYLGDTAPGAALARFVAAVEHMFGASPDRRDGRKVS